VEEIGRRIQVATPIDMKLKTETFIVRLKFWILLSCIFLIILFAPQIWLKIKYNDLIYGQVDTIPEKEYAIVFGAWVNDDYSLSDITRERVEAGIKLYRSQKVKKLFFSGDNRSNQQAEEMAKYAINEGVDSNDILIDKLGIDTNDTCKHFAQIDSEGILVTQGYHLPRTMLMCETSKINITGIAADKLGILSERGDSLLQIYVTTQPVFLITIYGVLWSKQTIFLHRLRHYI